MTIKVNRITIFINNFTKTGREANKVIKDMRLRPADESIYQKRFNNGSIALLKQNVFHKVTKDSFVIVKPDGSKVIKTTQNLIQKEADQKFHSSFKEFLSPYGQAVKKIKKSVLTRISDGKIEEFARKVELLDGSSFLFVRSSARRKTDFPATSLGGSIHPHMARKQQRPNGDIVWTERYPQN